jgi:hypothetical protein
VQGLFADLERLRPESIIDQSFLAAALYTVDRGGANMAMVRSVPMRTTRL